MAKEQYVTYETAKLLKEKGFPQSTSICNVVYKPNGKMSFNAKSFINPHYFFKDCYFFAPTQQMALCWLREEKGIHILPEISKVKENPKYYCMIWNTNNLESFIVDLFGSYEDAVETALEYCLTNLI